VQFDVRGDVSQVTRHLSSLAREQVPFATSLAINRTLLFARKKVQEEAKRVFDRPTRWTLSATEIKFSKKRDLTGDIHLREGTTGRGDAIRFLGHQIYGGRRPFKRSEELLQQAGKMPTGWYIVPASRAPLDRYGGFKRSIMQRVLSDVRAQFDVLTNRTKRSGRRRKGGLDYFSSWPPNRKTAHLKPGIYARDRGISQAIYPVLLFVPSVRYRKRYRFFETIDGAARFRFPLEFALAMRQAIRTAK
jgi:hypothetical protein